MQAANVYYKLNSEIAMLKREIENLEKNSHPPVLFAVCSRCYACIVDEFYELHMKTHG